MLDVLIGPDMSHDDQHPHLLSKSMKVDLPVHDLRADQTMIAETILK